MQLAEERNDVAATSSGGEGTLERQLIDLLTAIGDIITTAADPDEALEKALERAVYALQGNQGSVMLRDENDPNVLVISKATGLPEQIVSRVRVPLGKGIAGFVALRGETVAIRKGERHPLSQSPAGAAEFASLSVPLRIRNATIGVLNVRARPEKEAYTEAEILAACVVASQVAITVDVSRLLQMLSQRLDDTQRELVETNRLLSVARRQVQEILESIPSPVIVVDADGLVVLVNRATEELFGVDRTNMLSRDLPAALRNEEVGATLVRAVELAGREEAPNEVAVGPPSNRVFAIHVADLSGEEPTLGGGHVIALADVTELKELSELKSQLVSDTSHELRNPLTSILGAATALYQRGERLSAEERGEMLKLIADESRRLNSMITNILDASRIEAGRALELRHEITPLQPIIENVVKLQRPNLEIHEIITEVPEDLPEVEMDKEKIQQVLINLVDNAIKYSPNGGQIRIRAWSDEGKVCVSVSDEGVGIAGEDLPHVFERYRRVGGRLRRITSGAGLGLFLCKGIVEAHGGTISAESTPGEGSTFTFCLPLRQPKGEE